jgi:hypothetical protein
MDAGMNARIATIAVGLSGLVAAGLPAFAQQAGTPTAARAALHRRAVHRDSRAAVPAALAALPGSERLAVQSDLVWLGDYTGMSAEEFDKHMAEAVKAFQKRHNDKETGILSEAERALLAQATTAHKERVGWRVIDDTATGARVGIPEKLVPHTGPAGTGSRWTSGQGQIQVESFRLQEASLPALFEQEKKTLKRQIGYSDLAADSFVVIGEQRLKKFIVRAQSNGSEVRGITILYDQATEGTMASVAVAMADTFDGFPGPDAAPVPNRKRAVEYGSAIVVSASGDLLTLKSITEQCQSITVPRYGHADRVAEDETDDLALLRLYGARGLDPAALAGKDDGGDRLTLFGVAAPPAGDGAVHAIAAQSTGQGVGPAPPPGFSGAAAVDSDGVFIGIVDLKPAVVAGSGAAPQVVLVPAAAVRSFLDAHGMTAANAPQPMDRSVVQMICVRN